MHAFPINYYFSEIFLHNRCFQFVANNYYYYVELKLQSLSHGICNFF